MQRHSACPAYDALAHMGLSAQGQEQGTALPIGTGSGGRPILAVTGGKVGRGGVLWLHGTVGKQLEEHQRGGLTRGVVSMGAWLGRRGTSVRGGVRWWWSAAHGSRR
jgi:hypothetical protein